VICVNGDHFGTGNGGDDRALGSNRESLILCAFNICSSQYTQGKIGTHRATVHAETQRQLAEIQGRSRHHQPEHGMIDRDQLFPDIKKLLDVHGSPLSI
jgi:hypothetical protein